MDRVRYRVVVDFKRPHSYYGVRLDRATIGVLTAYCEMPNRGLRCPHWVDQAIGSAPADAASAVAVEVEPSSADADSGTTDAGYSDDLRFSLPSATAADGTPGQQYVQISTTPQGFFQEPDDPLDSFDGNDPLYAGDDGTVICGQCPPPDDGT